VIDNYVKCANSAHTHTKYFVKPDKVVEAGVHVCRTINGLSVNERKEFVDEGRFNNDNSFETIQLNHYYTKSFEEFQSKLSKGQVDGRDLKRIAEYKNYDYTEEDLSAKKISPKIHALYQKIHSINLNRIINYGFLSNSFIDNSNLSVKYFIRDFIEANHKSGQLNVLRHQKYNFGSVITVEEGKEENFLTICLQQLSKYSISDCFDYNYLNVSKLDGFGTAVVVGCVEAKRSGKVKLKATGVTWMELENTSEIELSINSPGVYCFCICLGSVYMKNIKLNIEQTLADSAAEFSFAKYLKAIICQ